MSATATTTAARAPDRPILRSREGGAVYALVILGLLGSLVVLTRLHTYNEPLDCDITTYAVVAREMLGGRLLYTDLFDHKPPGIHAAFAAAQLIAGPGPASIFLINVVATLATVLALYAAVRAAGLPRRAGLWAAGLGLLLSSIPGWQAGQPNAEALINPCLIAFFALLLYDMRRPAGWRLWLLAGALVAAASLFKHVAVFPVVPLALAYILTGPAAGERRRRFLGMAAAAAVAAGAWAAIGLYFGLHHRWHDFYDCVITYNIYYAGAKMSGAAAITAGTIQLAMLAGLPAAVAVVASWMGILRRPAAPFYLHLAFTLGLAVAVVSPGQTFPHYYQLMLPALALGLGWGVGLLSELPAPRRLWPVDALAAVLLAPLILDAGRALALSAEEVSNRKFTAVFTYTWHEAPRVRAMLRPGEMFWDMGAETGLYYLTGQRPLTGAFFIFPLVKGPLAARLTGKTLDELRQRPPDLITVSIDRSAAMHDLVHHRVVARVLENYRTLPTGPSDHFYHMVRLGSALDRRSPASP